MIVYWGLCWTPYSGNSHVAVLRTLTQARYLDLSPQNPQYCIKSSSKNCRKRGPQCRPPTFYNPYHQDPQKVPPSPMLGAPVPLDIYIPTCLKISYPYITKPKILRQTAQVQSLWTPPSRHRNPKRRLQTLGLFRV